MDSYCGYSALPDNPQQTIFFAGNGEAHEEETLLEFNRIPPRPTASLSHMTPCISSVIFA